MFFLDKYKYMPISRKVKKTPKNKKASFLPPLNKAKNRKKKEGAPNVINIQAVK